MIDKQFKKEAFKESVKENVKFLYRKKLEEATQEQIFQAVCYTCLLYTSPSPRDA